MKMKTNPKDPTFYNATHDINEFPPRPFIIPHFQFLAVAPAVPEKLIVASEIVNPDS